MSKGNKNRVENEWLEKTKVYVRRANKVTVGRSPLNPCILNSTTPVHPLGHRLCSIPVVKPMIEALSMARRGKGICISKVGVVLLMTLITPAPM